MSGMDRILKVNGQLLLQRLILVNYPRRCSGRLGLDLPGWHQVGRYQPKFKTAGHSPLFSCEMQEILLCAY